jgi:hypothetical protein
MPTREATERGDELLPYRREVLLLRAQHIITHTVRDLDVETEVAGDPAENLEDPGVASLR